MISTPNQQEDNALNQILSQRIRINWEVILYITIFLLAIFTRFYVLGDRVMSHDESLHTRFSYNMYADGNFQHTPLMHGPVLFHTTAFSYYLFGDNDFASRIYTAVLGVMMVMFPILFRRWLGKYGALLASLMLLISPLVLYYNRYIRHDTPSILFGMIMAYAILMYINGSARHKRRAYWLYIFAAAMVLNLGSKETAFIYIAIFGIFLFLYWITRLAQHQFEWQGKPIFYSVMLGILVGGVMTLGMYIIVDIIPAMIIPGRGTPWEQLSDIQRSSWLTWMGLTLLSGVFIVASTALYAFRNRLSQLPWREVILVFSIALITASGLLFIEELSHFPSTTETAEPIIPSEDGASSEVVQIASTIRWTPLIAVWAIAIAGIAFLVYNAIRTQRAGKLKKDHNTGGLWGFLYQFPEVDFIILIGTLILPWATAIIPRVMGANSTDYVNLAESLPEGMYNIFLNLPNISSPDQVGQILISFYAFVPLFVLMIAIGLAWNWRRWIVASAIFHVIFAFFFTTVFTNIAGLGTGMVYSLGYWLEQQGVRRGSQPQYYYLMIIMPMYEYLPIIGSIGAMFAGVAGFWKMRKQNIEQHTRYVTDEEFDEEYPTDDVLQLPTHRKTAHIDTMEITDDGYLRSIPFLLFVAWWAILNLVGYSLAGEKMPWLGMHLTTPMILLTAWYFGGIFDRLDKAMFYKRGWMALLVMPLFIITSIQVIGAYFIGTPPFAGLQQYQLTNTYSWIASLIVTVILAIAIYRIAKPINWTHIRRLFAITVFALLSVMTFRSAWLASFINYDLPTEFLVYAHAAPSIKWVLDDIEEMSLRMTDGKDIKFAYDNEVSWPYSWYFRDYPNAVFVGANPTVQNLDDTIFVVVGDGNRGTVEPILEDRYIHREYIRLWWPMQEYFNVTPERLLNVLDFSPENGDAAQIRQGIFDIWWARNYTSYGQATGKDFTITNWPVSDKMHVYIRKDFAAQIWEYGVGDGEVVSNLPSDVNQCNANWQELSPVLTIEANNPAMNRPIGMTVQDNQLYVAEEYANRISIFNTDGTFVESIDATNGDGITTFNRPNSVEVMDNGDLLVVDTWNYRIQQIDADGNVITQWGQPGEFGFDAPIEPVDGFWGPRDVVIDANGRAYVTDTGNKRVRVYQLDGQTATHLFDIGKGGSGDGELDEPSGLAIDASGNLYVADTWNRRIAVFDANGTHLYNFRVRGWYNDSINRPYLAIDDSRGMLYITDPDGNRVLVYTPSGDCIGSFGQAGENDSMGQFTAIGGITIDGDGFVYVGDSANGKIYKFAPFPEQNPELIQPDENNDALVPEQDSELMQPDEDNDALVPEQNPELMQPDENNDALLPDDSEEVDDKVKEEG